MLSFDFTNNPNGKLINDTFGDIRLKGEFNVGDECLITLKGVEMGYATIEEIRIFSFSRLTNAASLINCGKPAHYQAALLNRYYNRGEILPPDCLLAHIIFHYMVRNIDNQSAMLKEWWENKTGK